MIPIITAPAGLGWVSIGDRMTFPSWTVLEDCRGQSHTLIRCLSSVIADAEALKGRNGALDRHSNHLGGILSSSSHPPLRPSSVVIPHPS